MISVKNLYKSFGQIQVLNDVSFDVEAGKVIAVLGPNGSGKTTILKTMLGMVIPQKGKIVFNGQRLNGQCDYRKKIGYLPQIAQFPSNLRVKELIKMIKSVRNVPSNEEELIETFGLQRFLNERLGNLSGGTKQKVNIVLTFMFDSPLIILDEPTAGLDPLSLIHLKELIAKEKAAGKTFLVTTHIMSLVEELADEIIFLLEGKIYFQGSVEELKIKTDQKNLEHAIAEILNDHA